MILFGWVLWYINHYRLFNAKSSTFIYPNYIEFGLIRFYGISTIVGYLMSNPLSVRQRSGRPGFNPRSCHTKDFKNGT